MRTRIVRSIHITLSKADVRAIFAAINTAEMATAGVVAEHRSGLLPAIEKLERVSGVKRHLVSEWGLTPEGEMLSTVQYARSLNAD